MLDLLQKLVAIDTSNPTNLKPAFELIEEFTKINNLTYNKIPNTNAVLIETNPNQNATISFILHLDVVPANNWTEAFTPIIKNEKIYGRGVVDDKGPLVVALSVLSKAKTKFPNQNISVLIVSDEETENKDIQTIIKSGNYQPQLALVLDGGTHDEIEIGEKGVIRTSLKFTTLGGHSAEEKAEQNAHWQAQQLIQKLNNVGKKQPTNPAFKPFFLNVSSITARSMPYGQPQSCKLNIELQFPPPQTSKFWLNELKKLQKKLNFAYELGWVCEPHLIRNKSMLKFLKSIPNVKLITTGGISITKDLNLAGIPALGHCPVEEYNAHCDNEYLRLSDLERGEKFYLKLLKLWFSLHP